MVKGKWVYPTFIKPLEATSAVTLVKGYFSANPGEIKSYMCGNCRETPKLILTHHSNFGLKLFGCDKKCGFLIKIEAE